MKFLGVLILTFFFVTYSGAQTYNTENGFGQDFWTDTDSWDNGVPTCGGSPITITVDRDIIIRNTIIILNCEVHITITSSGRIRFGNTGSTTGLVLGEGSTITMEPGGDVITNAGGASGDHANNSITINGSEVWNGDGDNDFTPTEETTYTEDIGLPIELTSFNAEVSPDHVIISWTTSTEINNDYFTILRSQDGSSFEELARIQGAGNSSQINNYTFYDQNPLSGVSYYRLIQTDYDGKFEAFEIVSVEYNRFSKPQIEVYPNPCVEKLICRGISDAREMRILDEHGREVTQYTSISSSGSLHEIDVTRLQGGAVYLLKSGSEYVRFVKN